MSASTLNDLGVLIRSVTLAERIREAMGDRKAAALARAAKVSAAAVTQWLDGSTQSLKADVAALLEAETGYRATWLATGKGPKKVASAEPQPEYAGKPRPPRRVPVVGTAKMGEDGFYEELSSIPGAGDGHLDVTSADPDAYGLRVRGSSMAPTIRDGWYVLVEPNGRCVSGEPVLLKLRNGKKMVKELLYERPDSVEVLSVNGGDRITIYREELDSMQPVSGIFPPSKWKPE